MMLIKLDNMIFLCLFLDSAFVLHSVRSTGFDVRKEALAFLSSHQPNQGLQFNNIRLPDPTTALASRKNQVDSLSNISQPTVSFQNRRFRSRKNKRHQLSFYIHPQNGSRTHHYYFDRNNSEIKGSHQSPMGYRLLVNHTTNSENNMHYDENVKFGQSPEKNNQTRINSRTKRGNGVVSDDDEFTKSQPPITQTFTDDISGSSSDGDNKGIRSAPGMPYFDPKSPKEIKVALGSTAHMPCMARNIGTKPVSWIRNRDLHVLTVGAFSFTTDERFSAHRDTITKDWVLIVQHTDMADSGLYECSVPTKPVTSHTVELRVLVPRTELVGTAEVHLERGSSLNLTCLVHDSPSAAEFILWYHRDKLVNYGSSSGQISSGSSSSPEVRDRVTVQTSHHSDTSRSSLLVKNATSRDSGRYHCQPSNAPRVVALVHVIPSEDPAAMQTTNISANEVSVNGLLILVSLVMILVTTCNIVNPPQLHRLVSSQCTSFYGSDRQLSPEQKRCLCLRRCHFKSGQMKFSPRCDDPFKTTFNSCIENSKLMACRLRIHSSVRVLASALMYLEGVCEALGAPTHHRLGAKAKDEALNPLLSTPIRVLLNTSR